MFIQSKDFCNTPKAWTLRVVFGVISLWLAFVAASSVIRVMFYITFVALPLWMPSARGALHEAQPYIQMYTAAIYLFVWLLFSTGYIKGLGDALWKYGRFTNDMVRYPITAVGLTIVSSMLDTSKQMHPATFFTVVSIALVSYFVIRFISASIRV